MTENPTLKEIRDFVGGNIFGATFRKGDGTIRDGRFRLRVTKGVKGVGMSYDPESRGNLTVFDMENDGFRTIKLERLMELRANGQKFTFRK